MGIYFNPPLPNIGAAQPLTPRALTPPSSPTDPPFGHGLTITWGDAPVAWQQTRTILPLSGPAPQNPRFAGSSIPAAVLVAWLPPPPAPIIGALRTPASVAPQNPPFAGARIPYAVLMTAWLPPPPRPPSAVLRDPPISGPTPQAPPRLNLNAPNPAFAWWMPPTTLPVQGSYTPMPPSPPAGTQKYLLLLGVG